MNINRVTKDGEVKHSFQKKAVTIYDSVEDKMLSFDCQAECCRVAGITRMTLYYLMHGEQTSAMGKRYYRSKEDYINTQGEAVSFFDTKTGTYIHFASTNEAASTLGITWHSVNNLLIGKTSKMLGRYVLMDTSN